ncbi:MAG TPA: hypothetical protein VGM34_04435 [Chlamydiales bacterium]|jgi:hypothetical protein
MNLLPFIIAILLVLSYGASSLMQKHVFASKTHAAYLGLRRAERALLRKNEWARFNQLPGALVKKERDTAPATTKEKKFVPEPKPNPLCARLNLFPLLTKSQENHPEIYAQALKLLDLFYRKELFNNEAPSAKKLLDAILHAAQKKLGTKKIIALETLSLEEKELQAVYYLALKGTKRCKLGTKGYPPLIDFFKIDPNPSPICLFHAHPHILSTFFGTKNAQLLYQKLHTECKRGLEQEALLLLLDAHELPFLDPKSWTLLDLNRPQHKAKSSTLIAEDEPSGLILRRNIAKQSLNQ